MGFIHRRMSGQYIDRRPGRGDLTGIILNILLRWIYFRFMDVHVLHSLFILGILPAAGFARGLL